MLVFAAALALAIAVAVPLLLRVAASARCMDSRSGKILVALVVLCVRRRRRLRRRRRARPEPDDDRRPAARPAAVLAHTDLMVRAVDPQRPAPQRPRLRASTTARCSRRPATSPASGSTTPPGAGICMGVAPSGVDYAATIFDSSCSREHTIALTGLPSRARVSADGRYGAMTVFVSGDSYLESRDRLLDPDDDRRHGERQGRSASSSSST